MRAINKFKLIRALLSFVVMSFSWNASAQVLVDLNLWANPAGSTMITNYPVWVKVGSATGYVLAGNTNSGGRYLDSIALVTVPTPVTFLTYDCNGASISSTKILSPNAIYIGDTMIVACSSPTPGITSIFTHTPMTTFPAAIQFDGSSSTLSIPSPQGNLNYSWDFGDGTTGQGANVVHTFSTLGTFNVCLTVSLQDSVLNANTLIDVSCQTVSIGSPVYSCTANFDALAAGANDIQFLGLRYVYNSGINVSPDSTIYNWNFGDGQTSTSRDPYHSYAAAGSYYACFEYIALDSLQDTICTAMYCDTVVAGLPLQNGTGCQASIAVVYDSVIPNKVTLIDSSNVVFSGNQVIQSYLLQGDGRYWKYSGAGTPGNFSNTFTYNGNGPYQACVYHVVTDTVTGIVTCRTKDCITVVFSSTLSCQADFSYTSNPGSLQVNFSDSSTPSSSGGSISIDYSWDFGDGMVDTGRNPTHLYTSAGSYNTCLYLTVIDSSTFGVCHDTICKTVVVTGPTNNFCQASYIVDTVNSVLGNVVLWNTSTPIPSNPNFGTTYHWDFGDGSTSNLPYPVHNYASAGLYPVCLTVNSVDTVNNSCTATFCDTLGVDSLGNLIYKNTGGFTLNVMNPNAIGLEESPLPEFKVYPNPASDYLTISYGETELKNLEWSLADLNGAIRKKSQMLQKATTELTIPVRELNSGLYILTIYHNKLAVSHLKVRIL